MPGVRLRIPRQDIPVYAGDTLSVVAKARLASALDDLSKVPAPRGLLSSLPTEAITVWVSDSQYEALEALARAHRIDGIGPAASALLHGWAHAQGDVDDTPAPPTSALTTLDRMNQALGDTTRHDQAIFFTRISSELRARRPPHEVIFAEASTGIGKSRAYLAAIADWCASHPGDVAVLSAPTYSVLLQNILQWQRLCACVPDLPDSITLLGQQEFVSAGALERVLDEHPDTPGAQAARAWWTKGAPAAKGDPLGHPWLMRGLREATQGLWALDRQVQLSSDDAQDDAGMRAYKAQFVDARDVQLVFCTHAMLAVDVRLRSAQARKAHLEASEESVSDSAWREWGRLDDSDRQHARYWELQNDLLADAVAADNGRLPPIGLLVVDEAHLLEQSFARVFSSGTSVAALMRSLDALRAEFPRWVQARDVDEIGEVWRTLQAIGLHSDKDAVLAATFPALAAAIGQVRAILKRVLDRRVPAAAIHRHHLRHLTQVCRSLDIAALNDGERSGMATRVSWSPVDQWPSIEVGRYDVSRELDFLWSLSVQDRSLLVSATLYDDVSLAGLENTRRVLSVRQDRVRPLPPVRPSWLFDPVTLYLAGDTAHPDGLPRFRRPSRRKHSEQAIFDEHERRWRDDIGRYVAQAYGAAAGGMLVLLTAYSELDALLQRLDALPQECLIHQGGGVSLEAARMTFLRAIADGRRPCLLAVGSAWTGLDLSGDGLGALLGRRIQPHEDNILTDLIIPTAPIGTDRSLPQAWRREQMGLMADIGSASITLRQGLGRLVRREGLPPNRKIHFLDSRVHTPAWNGILRPVTRSLAAYTRRVTV